MLLEHIEEVGRVYLLLRTGRKSAEQRLDAIFEQSPVFQSVLQRLGKHAFDRIRSRIDPIAGDVSRAQLGITDEWVVHLRKELDLVVNLAGLVDFDPDVREACAANVEGPLHVANFVEQCKKARLLHVSTAYVSGTQSGNIVERILPTSPNQHPFDPDSEWEWLKGNIRQTVERSAEPQQIEQLRQELRDRGHDCEACQHRRCMASIVAASRLRSALSELGSRRARTLGWTNTYTYSKSLSERLLTERASLKLSIFRPTIVESASAYPFAGWNEGFNTSGPVIQLLGTWIHRLRVGTNKALDIIPVDYVARGLTIAAAALLQDRHSLVYQCGSSDSNPILLKRCVELSALAHRRYWREHGQTWLQRHVLSRWDARPVADEPWLGIGRLKQGLDGLSDIVRRLRLHQVSWLPFAAAVKQCDSTSRKLSRLESLLQAYQPFLNGPPSTYECRALREHDVVEPEFRFEPESIDWYEYMLFCHIPGIRKWCFRNVPGTPSETT